MHHNLSICHYVDNWAFWNVFIHSVHSTNRNWTQGSDKQTQLKPNTWLFFKGNLTGRKPLYPVTDDPIFSEAELQKSMHWLDKKIYVQILRSILINWLSKIKIYNKLFFLF